MNLSTDINAHLNLFHFFNEDENSHFIENNLSRALALCMKYHRPFLTKFIKAIASEEDFTHISNAISSAKFDLDIQVKMNSIEVESFKKVYAIAITGDPNLAMADFSSQPVIKDRDHHITDIWFSVRDIAFVIEIKISLEDCKAQLYNQVLSFLEKKITVTPASFPWYQITNLMENVIDRDDASFEDVFLRDFLLISEARYPEWFSSKRFSELAFNAHPNSVAYAKLMKRMAQCLSETKGYTMLDYRRKGLALSWPWATELIPWFAGFKEQSVAFTVWPGNTKAQGAAIYNKSLDWINKTSLNVEGYDYELVVAYDIKFSHFNRFVSNIYFPKNSDRVLKILHTPANYQNYSGRWVKKDWAQFESFLDSHFSPDFNWRHAVNWEQNFTLSDKTYFTVSFGFEVTVKIPFEKFCELDDNADDVSKVADFIRKIADAFFTLLE